MATGSQLRAAYASARCNTNRMARVAFHGWSSPLLVEEHTVFAWELFSAIMKKHDYKFRESAGGTYNCRTISGSSTYSLHAYGLAVDLNPSKNPYQSTLKTDMPKAFRDDIKRIKTGNGKRVFEWGGDWSGRKDAMHWEIDVTRSDLATGVTHPDTSTTQPPSTDEDEEMLPLQKGDGTGSRAHKKADVAHVQFLFNRVYPDEQIEVDGNFGSGTEKALKSKDMLASNGRMQGTQYGRLLWRVANRAAKFGYN